MDTADEGLPHGRERLGGYVLGALRPAEAVAVDKHLDSCPACAKQALELAAVRDVLGRLQPSDIATLTSSRDERIAAPDARPGRDARATVGPPDGRPPTSRPPDRTRPSRPRRRPAVLVSLAVALVVGIGLGLVLALRPPTEIALAGSETSAQTGASITVTVRGTDRGCHLEADIGGLTPRVSYRLRAAETSGSGRVAAEWTADGPSHHVSVDLPVAALNLATVVVTTTDGQAVVSVRVTAVRQ